MWGKDAGPERSSLGLAGDMQGRTRLAHRTHARVVVASRLDPRSRVLRQRFAHDLEFVRLGVYNPRAGAPAMPLVGRESGIVVVRRGRPLSLHLSVRTSLSADGVTSSILTEYRREV